MFWIDNLGCFGEILHESWLLKKAFRTGSAIRKSIIDMKKPDAPVLAVENYWEPAAVD